ncbi:MAG: hypothetical protein WBW74_15290 [Xanthobacteraceae bacterium]
MIQRNDKTTAVAAESIRSAEWRTLPMSDIEMVGVAMTVALLALWAWRYYATR